MKKIKNVGIILSGGIGARFGGDRPKQYYELSGKEVIWYTVDAFRRAETVDDFFCVVDENEKKLGHIEKEYGIKTILGGKTRNWSFKNALDYIKGTYPDCEKIIENNAACPMITPNIIDDFMNLLDEYDYVNTAYKITDALGSYKDRIANRDDFYLIQAPDAYHFEQIYKYFDADSPLGHPAHQLPMDFTECRYFDYPNNIKITYPGDIEMAELIMKRRNAAK